MILERERQNLERVVNLLQKAVPEIADAITADVSGQALTDAQQAQTKIDGALKNARKAAQRLLIEQLTIVEQEAAAALAAAQAELAALP